MTKILITGASGFIGNAFLQRFGGRNEFEIVGVGRRKLNHLPPNTSYLSIALSRLDELRFTPDVVIHAAGKAGPWGSPDEYWNDNVLTTEQVISFCNKRGKPRLLLISSAAVYYRYQHQLNISEQTAIGPAFVSHYARSKYFAE